MPLTMKTFMWKIEKSVVGIQCGNGTRSLGDLTIIFLNHNNKIEKTHGAVPDCLLGLSLHEVGSTKGAIVTGEDYRGEHETRRTKKRCKTPD
jgi:hypothetical protein